MYCAGIANDALLVTEEQFRGWAREYAIEVDGAGFSIDLPSCYLSQRPGPVREAVRQGAARFASFGTRPDDLMAEEQGRVIVVKDSATWSTPVVYAAVEGEEACDCGARASWQATDTRETPWRSWWLCSHCVAELLRPELLADIEKLERWADDVPSWETIEFAETVTKRLARIRRRWQRLTPPAELQAVFERFGNDAA